MAKVNYKKSEETFINPYNFVSVDTTKKSRPYKDTENVELTGVIKCNVFTKTPLAVPNVAEASNEKGKHSKYDCMKNTDGIPIIPGSSLRGVVRSVYETATNSCFSTNDGNSFITSRRENYSDSGVLMLENEEWHLYKADNFRFNTEYYYPGVDDNGSYIIIDNDKIYSGTEVKFKNSKPFAELSENGEKGILVLGEKIFGKKSEKIFSVKEDLEIDPKILDKCIRGLKQTVEIYRDKAINKNYPKNHNGYPTYERMKRNGCIPVWYKQDGNNLYLSFACRGRVAFNTTIQDMLDQLKSCEKTDDLCKACTLFGMMGTQSKSSMIRFTDAVCISEKPNVGYYTLQELSSPKNSYVPFYADIDKYDARNPVNYDDGLKIRGRKFYWHSNDFMSHICKEGNGKIAATPRNTTINLIDLGKQFTFNIYFDKISKEQLDELIWSLNFGENNKDSILCHKLCHGKPLGLGSAKITVESIRIRSYNDGIYAIKPYPYTNICEPKFVKKNVCTINDLKEICTFKDREMCYPFITNPKGFSVKDNDKAAHKWFYENKNGGMNGKLGIGGRDWDVQLLPSIKDVENNNNKLHAFEINSVTRNNNGYYKGKPNYKGKKQNNHKKYY